MEKLKPCPFCGGEQEYYTRRFKNDKRKVNGIYYKICTIKCAECTVTISSAGFTKERAEENAIQTWNRRAENEL